jgi:hypothetical protein
MTVCPHTHRGFTRKVVQISSVRPSFSTFRTNRPSTLIETRVFILFVLLNIKAALQEVCKGHIEKCGGESKLQDTKREKYQKLEIASEEV